MLEFLLFNHPLDCPVCDKGGECPLQDQSVSHGPGESRFVEEKRHWAKPIEIGPLVLLDRERCIQCARCTRFAEEVAGEPFIDFAERGDLIEVAIFPGEPFTSYFAGNTVQICPVGALTATPYRFKSRPWDLEQVETTCTTCAVGCRMVAQSSAGALVRYLGVDSEPVNQSWLCDRGRYGFEAVEAPEPPRRSRSCAARTSSSPASWHEALGEVAGGDRARPLEGSGRAAVGVIGGARLANEDAYAWVEARQRRHRHRQFRRPARRRPARRARRRACRGRRSTRRSRRSAVVVLAGDLREELPVLFLQAAPGRRERGPADPRLLAGADGSERRGTSLPYRPGEAAELARALVAAGGARGRRRADRLAAARPCWQRRSRGDAATASSSCSAAPRSPSRPTRSPPRRPCSPARGRGPVSSRRSGAATCTAPSTSAAPPGCSPGGWRSRTGASWFAEQWGSVPAERGLDTAGMLEAAAAGELETLVLLGADPLSDFPDRDLATRALERVDFLVAVDTTSNASSMLADVVLPAAGYAERGGTTTNLEGRVTRLAAKVVPPGVARADWVIATELAERLGGDLGFESLEGIWAEIERVAPAHSGCTGRRARRAAARPTASSSRSSAATVRAHRRPAASSTRSRRPGSSRSRSRARRSPPAPRCRRASSRSSDDEPSPSGGAPGAAPSGAGEPEPAAPPARLQPARPGRALRRRRLDGRRRATAGRPLLVAPRRPARLCTTTARSSSRRRRSRRWPSRRSCTFARRRWSSSASQPGDEVRVRSPRGELVLAVVADGASRAGWRSSSSTPLRSTRPSASALIDASAQAVEVRVETLS